MKIWLLEELISLSLQVDPTSAGIQYDKEFVVCSLDLISGLAEGLGGGIESLVLTFYKLLLICNSIIYTSDIHSLRSLLLRTCDLMFLLRIFRFMMTFVFICDDAFYWSELEFWYWRCHVTCACEMSSHICECYLCCRFHKAIWGMCFCNAVWMMLLMFDKVLLHF